MKYIFFTARIALQRHFICNMLLKKARYINKISSAIWTNSLSKCAISYALNVLLLYARFPARLQQLFYYINIDAGGDGFLYRLDIGIGCARIYI